MTQLINQFDYSNIDNNTVNFLRLKEEKMREVVGKAYTEIGKELKEAQDELSKCGYGCFEDWYVSLGFKKQSVYNYINRYELIVQQLDKRDVIEELPMNLSYEISKPSADPEIKQQVLDGEITNMKELREVKQQLQLAESKAKSSKEAAERFATELRNRPTIEKPVSMPTDLLKINQLENQLRLSNERLDLMKMQSEMNEKQANEYKELKKKIEFLHKEKDDIHRQIESATALSGLSVEIDNFLKTKLAPIRYSRALERMNSDVAVRNLTEILDSVDTWSTEMRNFLPKNNRKVVIIHEPTG